MFIESLYYFLPAYFANMAPILFRWIPFNKPIDFNKKWKGKRILGDHKTIRGFIAACILGTIIFYLQKLLSLNISIINYSNTSLWLGFLMSFGAIFGDSFKSFFKRRMNIPSGKPWIPFDQIDYVVFGLLFSFIIYIPNWKTILLILIASPILHILVRYSAFLLKINKERL